MGKRAINNSNMKLWILLGIIILSIVMIVFSLVKLFSSTEPTYEEPQKPSIEDPGNTDEPSDPGTTDEPGNTDEPSNPGNTEDPGTTDEPVTPPAPGSEAEALAKAEELAKGYFYDEAIAVLASFNSDAVKQKAMDIEKLKKGLVKYDGKIYHIFFHSLIIDTDLAFDNKGSSARNYNEVMTTVSEFKAMLPLLQEKGFVLYDITETCEYKDGKVTPKPIYLPEGKKPLILSIDDVNYYTYMVDDGFARYLDVDASGRVVTMVGGTPIRHNDAKKHVKGYKGCEISYEGDVMPILDTYVAEHPEFSFRGAKGIVAITGYEGAFGYRITDPSWFTEEEQTQMQNKVREVANALRNTGWQIANHSYTNNQYWANKTMTMEQLKYDTGRWINDIMPYVGETHILISPFGVSFKSTDERMKYITEELGFYIYCPVGSTLNTQFNGTYMLNERLNLDGMTMLWYPERISKYFFDPALVVDPERPELTK
ncbi:MAG: hypothetical protein IKM67_02810 [Clostridia bacterium]|nr:hypothetical protein [Clostridia bacterium]